MSLEKRKYFSLDLWAFHEWWPCLIKLVLLKTISFFLISAGSYNLLFNLLNLPQPNCSFLIYSPRIPLPYSHHCWENSPYLKWITQFFPPCPNYMFFVYNSPLLIIFLSHEDVQCLHVPQALAHPSGRSAHYQGQGHKWITKRSTMLRNLVWRAILLRPWNTIFPICS